MESNYIEWLKKNDVRLFEGGGTYWRLYHGALIPASAMPCIVELRDNEPRRLMRESGAFLLRYTDNPREDCSEWWYIICDSFDVGKLASKVRNEIRRGNNNCTAKQIDAAWLEDNGYDCYFKAFSRYKNAVPVDIERFRSDIRATFDGPFEYWGVFKDDRLAGYCQCIIEDGYSATNVIKYDPALLKYYSSYALMDTILNHYVIKLGLTVCNGSRSISHDTNMQDFLLKFGFRKQFCRLNIVYRPVLKIAIQSAFPFKRLIDKLPSSAAIHRIQALLYQEQLRKSFNDR